MQFRAGFQILATIVLVRWVVSSTHSSSRFCSKAQIQARQKRHPRPYQLVMDVSSMIYCRNAQTTRPALEPIGTRARAPGNYRSGYSAFSKLEKQIRFFSKASG